RFELRTSVRPKISILELAGGFVQSPGTTSPVSWGVFRGSMLLLTRSKIPELSKSFQRTWLNSCVNLMADESVERDGRSGAASRIRGAPRLMPVVNHSWLWPFRVDVNKRPA